MPTAKQFGLTKSSQTLKHIEVYGPLDPDNVAELYATVAHLMSEEHRAYLERMLNGEAPVDALLDLEMMLRLVTIYATQAIKWSFEKGSVSKDIGSVLGEARQAAVAVESMRLKRQEAMKKNDDNESVVDPTQQSSLARFENLH